MIDGQMELGFGKAAACPPVNRRQRRVSRANWWFARMREVVDRAFDWQPAPPARPEQIWFADGRRQAQVPAPPAAETQICE